LNSSPNIIRMMMSRMRWAGLVAHMGRRGMPRILVGKPKGKKPLGRPRCRWEYNITRISGKNQSSAFLS
jgi:hypothetical protein